MKASLLFSLGCLALLSLAPRAGLCADQNVVVVLDDSGSMDETIRTQSGRTRRIEAAKQALIQVLSNLPTDTKVGVLALNTQVNGSNWIVPFGALAEQNWRGNIAALRAQGGTPLGEFLRQGSEVLLEARENQRYGEYRLLIVTDGEANDPALVDDYLPQILARGITTDVIGVAMQSDHSLATRVHNYRRATDDSSLQQAISSVFAETSLEDQDSGDGFELLEGLPDEFAVEAIKALTEVSNAPLQRGAGTASIDGSGSYGGTSLSGSSGSASWAGITGGILCCFGSGVMLTMLILVLVMVRKNPRR